MFLMKLVSFSAICPWTCPVHENYLSDLCLWEKAVWKMNI